MKVLIIGINYAPEFIGIGLYTTGLAEYLAAEGDKVDVLTALPYYPGWKVKDGWPRYGYFNETSDSGIRIIHAPLYVPLRPSGIKRIFHYASFTLTAAPAAAWLALRNRPDIVFVVAPSLISALTGWMAARLARAKGWLHIHDLEVDTAIAIGLLNDGTPLARVARGFERWILGRFDRISSISAPMIARIEAKGLSSERMYEFRNWAEVSALEPLVDVSLMKRELGIETPYVALYSGTIANKQGIEIIPEMARYLRHRGDLTIVICGDGPNRAWLEEQSRDIAFIRFLPLQPRDRLSDLLGMADVHLLPQVASAADLVLPSKLTNMLASGRPILATTPSDTALGREVDGCGVVVAPGDAEGMARALEDLLDDPDRRASMGVAARLRAVDRFAGAKILGHLRSELARLVRKPASSPIQPETKAP